MRGCAGVCRKRVEEEQTAAEEVEKSVEARRERRERIRARIHRRVETEGVRIARAHRNSSLRIEAVCPLVWRLPAQCTLHPGADRRRASRRPAPTRPLP